MMRQHIKTPEFQPPEPVSRHPSINIPSSFSTVFLDHAGSPSPDHTTSFIRSPAWFVPLVSYQFPALHRIYPRADRHSSSSAVLHRPVLQLLESLSKMANYNYNRLKFICRDLAASEPEFAPVSFLLSRAFLPIIHVLPSPSITCAVNSPVSSHPRRYSSRST